MTNIYTEKIKELIKKIDERQEEIVDLYKNGDSDAENIKNFNAMCFALGRAEEVLKKGLKGEF